MVQCMFVGYRTERNKSDVLSAMSYILHHIPETIEYFEYLWRETVLKWTFTCHKFKLTYWHVTCWNDDKFQFSSVQSLSRIRLFATPWITAGQATLSITKSQSLLKLMSIESVMPSSHLIFCRPLLLLPPIPPSIRVFSKESTLHMRWPKYWSFSFSICPSNEHTGLTDLV